MTTRLGMASVLNRSGRTLPTGQDLPGQRELAVAADALAPMVILFLDKVLLHI
jgi:hypothetical protein